MGSEWSFAFLLHNLTLSESFESEYVIACNPGDERLLNVYEAEPLTQILASRFHDAFGSSRSPTTVLFRKNLPERARNWDGLVAWRNCFAMASLLEGWQAQIRNPNNRFPVYSDFFDIYPIFVHDSEKHLIARSIALLGIDIPEKFQGQTSPGLPPTDFMAVVWNAEVGWPLVRAWGRKYILGDDAYDLDILFRSLDVAFQASRMPGDDGGSIFEFGSHAALWVSAFEIICHPATGYADLGTVLDLIEKVVWVDETLDQRTYQTGPKGRVLNLAQETYRQLYATRNAFLHGNPVTAEDLFPFRRVKADILLTQVAPVIYWFALMSTMRKGGLMEPIADTLEGQMRWALQQGDFEEALKIGTGFNEKS